MCHNLLITCYKKYSESSELVWFNSAWYAYKNQLDPHPSGFKTGHATETALLVVTLCCQCLCSQSLLSVVILLATLAKLSNADSELSWFTSYLTNHTYQVSWNGSLSKTLHSWLSLVSLKALYWYTSVLPIYQIIGLCNHITWFILSLLRWRHSDGTLIATHISECLADISTWTTAHHLKLNLKRTEPLLMPGKDCLKMDLLVTVEGVAVSPSPPSSRGKQLSLWSLVSDT